MKSFSRARKVDGFVGPTLFNDIVIGVWMCSQRRGSDVPPDLRDQWRRIRFGRERNQPVPVQHVGSHENRLLVQLEQPGQIYMPGVGTGCGRRPCVRNELGRVDAVLGRSRDARGLCSSLSVHVRRPPEVSVTTWRWKAGIITPLSFSSYPRVRHAGSRCYIFIPFNYGIGKSYVEFRTKGACLLKVPTYFLNNWRTKRTSRFYYSRFHRRSRNIVEANANAHATIPPP